MSHLKYKLLGILFISIAVIAGYRVLHKQETSANIPVIGMTTIIDHPVMNKEIEGLKEGMKKLGYIENKTIKYLQQSAQGNISLAGQIPEKFITQGVKSIVAFSTPSAQAAIQICKKHKTPLIFMTVTDPVDAKLIKSIDEPEQDVTGMTDGHDMKEQIRIVMKLFPKANRVGVLYNPGEMNSVKSIKSFKEEAQNNGIEIIEGVATKTSETEGAVRSLVGKVDIIYVPNDNTFVSAMPSVSKVAAAHKLPIIAADDGSVETGAIFAYAYNRYEAGKHLAIILDQVLKGKKNIPVTKYKSMQYVVNKKMCDSLGVSIPTDILQKAVFVK